MNARGQQRLRKEKRRKHLAKSFKDAEVERNTILDILRKNKSVEEELTLTQESNLFADSTVAAFLQLKPASKLEDFIHARKFTGKSFSKTKLVRPGQKLNKTLARNQTAQSIEEDCSEENPCLVWLAWRLRSSELVLKAPPAPVLLTSLKMLPFTVTYAGEVTYAGQVVKKCLSGYLRSTEVSTIPALTLRSPLICRFFLVFSDSEFRLYAYFGVVFPILDRIRTKIVQLT